MSIYPTSVSVRLWHSLSGDSHFKLTSANTSQHPSCLGCKLLFQVVGGAEDKTQYFVHAGQALCQLSCTLLLNKHSLQMQAFDCSPVFILFYFYYSFYAFTFQIISPSLLPLHKLHLPILPLSFDLMRVLLHILTHSHLTDLASHYTGASSLHRTNGLPSH